MMGSRMARLREELVAQGLDAMVVHHNSSLHWLTGYRGIFDEEEAHLAIVFASPDAGCAVLQTDSRYINNFTACAHAAGDDMPGGWEFVSDGASHAAFLAKRLHAEAERVAAGSGADGDGLRVGIENDIPLSLFRAFERELAAPGSDERASLQSPDQAADVEFVETDGFIEGLRAIKEPSEIELLTKAQAITDAAFSHMLDWMKVGMTELEIAEELEHTMKLMGSEGISFPSIIAAGKNGASPHSLPGETRVQEGDFLIMDFGAMYQGYHADMTRTVCFGEPTDDGREVYDIVRRAHEDAAAALLPGKTGAQIHAIAADVIAQAGYGKCFGHGLGHGVGLDIHEDPRLSPSYDRPLPEGCVVTVEPGIYLPGRFGIRIEDCGVLTGEGFKPFTAAGHELIVIGR